MRTEDVMEDVMEDVSEDGGRRTEDVVLIPIIFELRRFNPFQACGESSHTVPSHPAIR